MLLLKCDWCARTIDDTQQIGIYTTQIKSLGLPSKSLDLLMNSRHICEKCMEKAGTLMLADRPSEAAKNQAIHQVTDAAAKEKESASAQTERPETAKGPETSTEQPKTAAPVEPKPQPGQEPPSSEDKGAKKSDKVVDVDKILALKRAGWRVKAIAEEMDIEPTKVSNILCYTKKNHPDKWKAYGFEL